MPIQRDDRIRFHEQGTLTAVTRWVASDDEGVAEWLKNTRRAYQADRAAVDEAHRTAIILLRDAHGAEPAIVGVLDVGGASSNDLARWSIWQDPDASRAGGTSEEEETQGNGGKAYMYRMFRGATRILGVAGGLRNAKGFEGPEGSVERGIPGFVPTRAEAFDAASGPWKSELNEALAAYGLTFDDLPAALRRGLETRQAFTLVEGHEPKSAFQGRINAEGLVERLVRHDQMTVVLEQLKVYAAHNGCLLNEGEPLKLEEIEPYEGFERPRIIEIPETLASGTQTPISTTADGTKPLGRVTLRTSQLNMPSARKKLRPRWKITYRTLHQMIGSKPISEIVPTTPGSYYVYGTVELAALEPDYVTHGRIRPGDGPLMEALDEFLSEQIRILAREIHERTRRDLDERELDEVFRENQMLDRWKDQFLPSGIEAPGSESGDGSGPTPPPPPPRERGVEPFVIEVNAPPGGLHVGAHVRINLKQILSPVVRDEVGRAVSGLKLLYKTDNPQVLRIDSVTGEAEALGRGTGFVYVQVSPGGLSSDLIPVRVVLVDHVLLSPRQIEVQQGARRQITATVTSPDGDRFTDVLLNWRHDAEDTLIVRVHPRGVVTGNRVGTTRVYAGAGDQDSGVWSRVPAAVTVIPNQRTDGQGAGHPQLKVTGRDIDPDTGLTREGDPQQPVLWQESADVGNNIWWLNLEAPEAALAFSRRDGTPEIWRMLHASKLVEMVGQVHMYSEFMAQGDSERPEPWAIHKLALERYEVDVAPGMWEQLGQYVLGGGELE